MRRLRIGTFALALALSAAAPAGVGATAGRTTMSGTVDLNTFPVAGTFTVESGPLLAVCTGGVTVDDTKAAGAPQAGRVQLRVIKTFTCDEGPVFVMQLLVSLDFLPTFRDTFSWSVLSGEGGLAGLHGAGRGFGGDGGDHYSGVMVLN